MKFLLIFPLLIFSYSQQSLAVTVAGVAGQVSVVGSTAWLKKGDVLAADQAVMGHEPNSRLQLNWETGKVVLTGKFKIQLLTLSSKSKDPSTIELLYGKVRAQTSTRSKSDPLRVVTPVAVAGVRGTDFMVTYDELLGESEVICFESEVDFSNASTKKAIVVGPGQWGGVGLRFGEVRDPLTLSPKILKAIEASIPYLTK